MIYFSQLIKTSVKDSADSTIGSLQDIVMQPEAGHYAPLLFLVVLDKQKQKRFIPYSFVSNLSREAITLSSLSAHIPSATPPEGATYLQRDIMDEQIVDVGGARVVRVNDLKLGTFEQEMCVLGIDVSFKGILRRLGLAWLDFFDFFKVQLIDWRQAHLVKGALQVNTVAEELTHLHPADLANIIEDLTVKQGSTIMDSLDSAAAAQVLEEVDPALQKTIISYLGPERAHDIVEKMSIDEAVDLLQMLPKEKARNFLSYLQEGQLKKIGRLINYADDTAGGLMTTEYVDVDPEATVEETIAVVRRDSPHFRSLLYIYVTDADNHFIGTVSVRTLLLSGPKQKIKDILKPIPENSLLTPHQDIDTVIRIMTKYNLISAAVVDVNQHLLGVITIDDVMRYLVPNA